MHETAFRPVAAVLPVAHLNSDSLCLVDWSSTSPLLFAQKPVCHNDSHQYSTIGCSSCLLNETIPC